MRTLGLFCAVAMLAACANEQGRMVTNFDDRRNSDYSVVVAATVLRQGNYSYAAAVADGALAQEQIDPQSRKFAQGIRAAAALHTAQYDRAAQALDAIVKQEPAAPDSAVADAAIAAHPNRPEGYFVRARLSLAAGNYSQATSDCDIAIGLETAAVRVTARDEAAWISFTGGHFQQTVKNLGDNSTNAAQPYTLLLLHVARGKIGQDDKAEMGRAVDAAGQTEWPAPILAFYLGRIDRKQLFAAAENGPDYDTRERQRCEANFHAGEEAALRNDMDDARDFLRAARDDCPSRFDEAEAAGAEYARMRQ